MYKYFLAFLFFLYTGVPDAYSQLNTKDVKNNTLQRSIPEQEGVSSAAIIDFLNATAKSTHEFHSFIFLRHGKIVAEGWWDPYKPNLKHTLYSLTKSFMSTAAGFAIAEGRISLSDKVVDFFPEKLPDTLSDYWKQMTVKDLLTMSTGQDPDPTQKVIASNDWTATAMTIPVVHQPGTKFLYNNVGPNLLSAILQKKTGQTVMDYLKPRLFGPLGITEMDWERDPQGNNTGGWGLRVTTESLAKLGLLYLRKGKWNGRRVLPGSWVKEATSVQILQKPEGPASGDWEQGYGYYFWRCLHNAYRGDGAFGQFMIMLPEQDAVIAITAETMDMQGELDLVWKYLLPSMHKNALPSNPVMAAQLKRKLASLKLPVPASTVASPLQGPLNGKSYELQTNTAHLKNISFRFAGDSCNIVLKTDKSNEHFSFTKDKWALGETDRHGPYLLPDSTITGPPLFKTASAYYWKDAQTLELVLRYIDTPHTETFTCKFKDQDIALEIHNSLFASQVITIPGRSKE
ncbi:MAG: serine hydrolase [Sphingobacteriales bacterium]|nr:serine hydrolase [Sphingobacteriales bacterium]OJW04782.1 MAG: hypothetical protein BGO52_19955 [Sphingobacteriales bacterium 44-61]